MSLIFTTLCPGVTKRVGAELGTARTVRFALASGGREPASIERTPLKSPSGSNSKRASLLHEPALNAIFSTRHLTSQDALEKSGLIATFAAKIGSWRLGNFGVE
jgi:hypothetical protein